MIVTHYPITTRPCGDAVLLAAVPLEPASAEHTREVALFFKSGSLPDTINDTADMGVRLARNIGGGLQIIGSATVRNNEVTLPFADHSGTAPLTEPETTPLAGKRVALALHGVETPEMIYQWLAFHREAQGLEGALILTRQGPEAAEALATALSQRPVKSISTVLVVSFDTPLGRSQDGDETLPFYAPDAPGRDRMEFPTPDPWRAPFTEIVTFELLRHLFLAQARGVLNLALSDLLPQGPQGSVFDLACAAPAGMVPLIGHRIYPWSLHKKAAAGFGDHICRRFDASPANPRWCLAPAKAPAEAVWRLVRVVGAAPGDIPPLPYLRCMALRHTGGSVSQIVPKSSLVEDADLLKLAQASFGTRPRRPPRARLEVRPERIEGRCGIVTCMKNEGPFILEWLAHHRAIGVDDFLIYTNDCTDGTDRLLDLLQERGIVTHRDNPYRGTGMKPQHAALQAAADEPLVHAVDWMICIDVDEFINIHVGAGRLEDLFDAVPDANMISMTWRLFGNSDLAEFEERFVTEAFTRCAPQESRKPHQSWGFKTAFRQMGIFKKLGVHRPKGLQPQLVDQIRWVNGSGLPMPRKEYRNAWRSTQDTYGYDLVTLNHYAVRSAESFLVKRDRGRVNHVDRDQGLIYWFRMNNNREEDRSIARLNGAVRAEYDRLLADPQIAAAHAACVAAHHARIAALRARPEYAAFYAEITSHRMQRLSRMLPQFGANVFQSGPSVVPDAVLERAGEPGFFFTIRQPIRTE
ncbi:glycosyltransferase family 2 protein [uncultured Roseobacter sp.]|uniref:glycosyltransferase family 2 protein n=1 Tax=uncultured Roseobacter sp. TaxID=114847 RepID=UPI00260B288E|nr:glycosyltransferase family 2 protein [uncultured Roseobacter sp.]